MPRTACPRHRVSSAPDDVARELHDARPRGGLPLCPRSEQLQFIRAATGRLPPRQHAEGDPSPTVIPFHFYLVNNPISSDRFLLYPVERTVPAFKLPVRWRRAPATAILRTILQMNV